MHLYMERLGCHLKEAAKPKKHNFTRLFSAVISDCHFILKSEMWMVLQEILSTKVQILFEVLSIAVVLPNRWQSCLYRTLLLMHSQFTRKLDFPTTTMAKVWLERLAEQASIPFPIWLHIMYSTLYSSGWLYTFLRSSDFRENMNAAHTSYSLY